MEILGYGGLLFAIGIVLCVFRFATGGIISNERLNQLLGGGEIWK